MSFSGYYNDEGVLQYCYYGNQYTWNPSVWGYYPGWTMYWTGSCGDESYFSYDIYFYMYFDYFFTYSCYYYYYTTWSGEWW